MPATIMVDYPQPPIVRRLRRTMGVFVGSVMVFIGLVASVVAVPTTLLVASLVGGGPGPGKDVSVELIVVAWGVSTVISFLGLKFGLRLLRAGQERVLFLRRFGYRDATRVVTFAAKSIDSMRLVTLDDKAIAPIGVSSGVRRFFRVGSLMSRGIGGVTEHDPRFFGLLVSVMWVILAIKAVQVEGSGLLHLDGWDDLLRGGALDPYGKILSSLVDGHPPFNAVGWDLPGVFALVGILAAIAFVVLLVTIVGGLSFIPFTAVLFFLSSSNDAVLRAEQSKIAEVRSAADIDRVASEITVGSRRFFAPRLVVLRVESEVWRQTVRGLASGASVALIDLSEPTENVLWELEELIPLFGTRCVLVGHHERVAWLATLSEEEPAPGSVAARLSPLVAGREVLAYATDRRGMKRFARALQAKMLTVLGDTARDTGGFRPTRDLL